VLEWPELVVHASVGVDAAMTGFVPDLGVHYSVVGDLACDAHLVGYTTMVTGLQMAEPSTDPQAEDRPTVGRDERPWWFIVDSGGALRGSLHRLRAFPGLRDVGVLVAAETPQEYRSYLTTGGYATIEAGHSRVDLPAALAEMATRFGVRRVLVDSGPVLTTLLLDQGLVDEVSLVVHPVVVGSAGERLFAAARQPVRLERSGLSELADGLLHVRYRVLPA
jgi:2,5-diamino-6-(ribosylamino)-4(3H)-pyrimidinone 5'-phosphate reductase